MHVHGKADTAVTDKGEPQFLLPHGLILAGFASLYQHDRAGPANCAAEPITDRVIEWVRTLAPPERTEQWSKNGSRKSALPAAIRILTPLWSKARGGGGWLLALVLLVALGIGLYYFANMSNRESAKDNAIAEAARDVGGAAQDVGDAAKDAARKLDTQ